MATESFKKEKIIDAKGLPCPLPLLKTKKALNLAKVGTKIILLATDFSTKQDIFVLCQKLNLGFEVIEKDDYFEIHIKK